MSGMTGRAQDSHHPTRATKFDRACCLPAREASTSAFSWPVGGRQESGAAGQIPCSMDDLAHRASTDLAQRSSLKVRHEITENTILVSRFVVSVA